MNGPPLHPHHPHHPHHGGGNWGNWSGFGWGNPEVYVPVGYDSGPAAGIPWEWIAIAGLGGALLAIMVRGR
jgi:hypothetical protein